MTQNSKKYLRFGKRPLQTVGRIMTRILSYQTEKQTKREMILFSSSHHDQFPTTRLLAYFSINLILLVLKCPDDFFSLDILLERQVFNRCLETFESKVKSSNIILQGFINRNLKLLQISFLISQDKTNNRMLASQVLQCS